MIAALSMAFLSYASPLANATNYLWTTPNMPSNIAGVVAGPFARTEDIAYIHEAIVERRVLGGLGSGASTIPVQVLRSASLPLTPAQAQAKGWHVVSTGIVDGIVNVLAYRETVTNWPKAGGADTWRMRQIAFDLPSGSWLHPSNDVSNLQTAIVANANAPWADSFSPWRGYMPEDHITLHGLAWRSAIDGVLHKLDDYRLNVQGCGTTTNLAEISQGFTSYQYPEISEDGTALSLEAYYDPIAHTNHGMASADFGFSVRRTANKFADWYLDEAGDIQECYGSPTNWVDTYSISNTSSIGGRDLWIYSKDIFSTGGVQRIKSAKVLATFGLWYNYYRYVAGEGRQGTITSTNLYVSVPMDATLQTVDANGYTWLRTSGQNLHEAAKGAAIAAAQPTADSGYQPPVPTEDIPPYSQPQLLQNWIEESLVIRVQNFGSILTVEQLTTI